MRREAVTKFHYNLQTSSWDEQETIIAFEESPFASGAMRYSFKGEETDKAGTHRVVVKVFRSGVPSGRDRACFDEALTQTVAESYAQDFNRCCGEKVAIVPVSVCKLHTPFRGVHHVTVEPYLTGTYVKHSNNAGAIATRDHVPQTFSHFAYEASNETLVICDIQGVGSFYTDPQIHSVDGKGFGLGNLGVEGIQRFLHSHHCNALCRRCGLLPVQHLPLSDREVAQRLQARENAQQGFGHGRLDAQMAPLQQILMGYFGADDIGQHGVWTSAAYENRMQDILRHIRLR